MRQVRLLENIFGLTVAGFGDAPTIQGRYITIDRPRTSPRRKILWALRLLSGSFESYYWNLPYVKATLLALQNERYDLIIANDLPTLPIALRLAGNTPVLFDAHEYSPREYENQFAWRLLFQRYVNAMCSRYIPQVAAITTVCQSIADAYAAQYKVQPLVIHNAPYEQPLAPSPIDGGQIRLIHHGVASRVRRLELTIEMMSSLDDRFYLDFMLMESEPDYFAYLVDLAKGNPRIRFVKPVPMQEIPQTINPYDIGVFLLPPDNFNYQYALPNKFFEFIQARLVIAIGPSPEMKAMVEKYQCGVVASTFAPKELANALNTLTKEDLHQLKCASHSAAGELGYEHDARRLLDTVNSLVTTK